MGRADEILTVSELQGVLGTQRHFRRRTTSRIVHEAHCPNPGSKDQRVPPRRARPQANKAVRPITSLTAQLPTKQQDIENPKFKHLQSQNCESALKPRAAVDLWPSDPRTTPDLLGCLPNALRRSLKPWIFKTTLWPTRVNDWTFTPRSQRSQKRGRTTQRKHYPIGREVSKRSISIYRQAGKIKFSLWNRTLKTKRRK